MKIIIFLTVFIFSQYCYSIPKLNFPNAQNSKLVRASSLQGAGFGWDFLSDGVRYPIQTISYKDNKLTSDGKYLVPDCMMVEDVKRTRYTDLSDIIETSYKYVSKTSKSMKVGGSLGISMVSVGGSYSKDYFEMIEEQKNTSTVTARTRYLDHRYTLLSNSRCPLDTKFVQAIQDLIFCVEYNIEDLAVYLAELLVSEYGTHYVRKVSLGGTIYADDYFNDEYYHKMKESIKTVQTSASIGFSNDYINFSASFESSNSVTSSEYTSYKNSIKRTYIDAIGGQYIPGMPVSKWAETLENNIVPIDREVDLLSNVLLFSNFPAYPAMTVYKASTYVQNAISKYLKENTIEGCTNRNSINYQPFANFDPGNKCTEVVKFGGIISSTCGENNVLTNTNNCPAGYVERLISLDSSNWLKECIGLDFIKEGAVYFGGAYSGSSNNPVTEAKSCPNGFKAQKIFDCSNNFICVSTNFEIAIKNAIPFGGFVSDCFTSQVICPVGFERKFFNVINGCEIAYCTLVKKIVRPRISSPPFVPKPPSYRLLELYKQKNSN